MTGHCSFRLFMLITACVFSITTGCADEGMVEVAGKVSMDGVAVSQGTISFVPADGRGATAEAVIKDGSYSVTMPRGDKKVSIHGFAKVGERFPWGKDNPAADVLKEIVPKEFNEESKLMLNAKVDDMEADFELASPK